MKLTIWPCSKLSPLRVPFIGIPGSLQFAKILKQRRCEEKIIVEIISQKYIKGYLNICHTLFYCPIYKRIHSFQRPSQLTITEWGWTKYRDLSVASRSIICRRRRLRQITDLRNNDKSRYFAITEFNHSITEFVCNFLGEAVSARCLQKSIGFLLS